jgi:predicted acylesterase/phospholipase RssA
MTRHGEPRRALVLSGGSVYAAYEVGVMKALVAGESPATGLKPIDPEVYVGTSAGSLNAALITSHSDGDPVAHIDHLENVWIDHLGRGVSSECSEGAVRVRGDVTRYLDPSCVATNPLIPLYRLTEDAVSFLQFGLSQTAHVLSNPGAPMGRRLLECIDLLSLISVEGFSQLIYDSIDLKSIRASAKALRIATTNWRTGLLRVFGNDEMRDEIGHDVIRASAAFPGIPPIFIEGDPYADGGYVLNSPLSPAIHAGADELHVIFMDPEIKRIPVRRIENTFDVLDKLYHITLATIFKRDIDVARSINRGLTLIGEGAEATVTARADARALLLTAVLVQKTAATTEPPKLLTIHLYHPGEDLGGILGLMNFDRGHIAELINKGYADAVAHDCQASGCILPG